MIKKIFYTFAFIILIGNYTIAQQGKVDVTFNTIDDGHTGDGFDNAVRTLSLQTDQNLIVGGDYLSLNGIPTPYLTRLKPDGSIDETFETGSGFNGKVYSSCIQPDGKIIVGGSFTSYNGISAGRLIRLNKDGSYDATFNTTIGATAGIISDIALLSDGSLIVVGSITRYNNIAVYRVARILSNGALDSSFLTGSGSTVNINCVKVLHDGKILLAGNFTRFNNSPANAIIRLNEDGSIDASFNTGTGFDGNVNAVEIQSDHKILLGGSFTLYNSIVSNRIIRLNEDGSIDSTFISGSGFSSGAVQVIKTDAFGNIMVGGSFTGNFNGTSVNRVCLLNNYGMLNDEIDFGSGPATASVLALRNDVEGSWYIGGTFSVFDGLNQGRLAKINSEGEYDTGYLSSGIGFDNSVYQVLPLENAKTMVLGKFKKFNGAFASRIVKLLEDGSTDFSFNTGQLGANDLIKTAAKQSDGKVILGGNFTKYNETLTNRLVRIFPNGLVDPDFNIGSGFNSQIYAIAIQSDGNIIVAGNFTRFNGTTATRIIRLLPDGSRDNTFDAGVGANAIIESLLIQPDGKILVAGHFSTFNNNELGKIVRLNSNGSIDTSFNSGYGFDKYVYSMAFQSNQKIIVGGSFLTYNRVAQKRLLRLNTDGSLDTTFQSGTGFSKGDVRSILVQPDDRILVGGTFSGTYKNIVSLRLIRLLNSGDLDTSFDAPLNNKLYAMCFGSDYKLVIGGDFNSVSGISKHRIARLKLCLESTNWNGVSWSNGYPSGGKEVFFNENYTSLTSSDICSCTIDEGKTVTLLSGNTLAIEFGYTGLGTLVLEDSANLYQEEDDILNTGVVNLKRKSSPIVLLDYTYWSSPVKNQKLINVSPNTYDDKFFSFNYNVKNWQNENPENTMILGKGYIIRGPYTFSSTVPKPFEATFKGIPNNGKIAINIANKDVFNLIGNPYPSTLNADDFLVKNAPKIKGTLYFWTHNTPMTNGKYATDDYAVYNLLGGVGTRSSLSSGINESVPDKTIASGQSFFVASNDGGTVEFDNSMRMKEKNSNFFKPVKNNKISTQKEIEKHCMWLNFKNSEGAFKQLLLGYINGATNSYDVNYDAESLAGNKFVDFYSIIENKNFTIQGRALPFDKTDSIELGYMTSFLGEFSFSIDHQDGLFLNQDIFIEDKDLKLIYNLKDGAYLFKSEKGTFNNRFVLKYVNNNLEVNKWNYENENVFVFVKEKVITVETYGQLLKEVSVFDVSGKQVYKKNKIGDSKCIIQNGFSKNQILLVKIELENGATLARKIII